MDTEHMREVLATKAMGWHKSARERRRIDHYWYDSGGERIMHVDHWHPDADWEQCGKVIEAMREKYPAFAARRCVDVGWYASFGKRFKQWGSWYLPDGPEEVYADTFTEAVSLAACRALEATNAQQ